jgi:hypothetical protein
VRRDIEEGRAFRFIKVRRKERMIMKDVMIFVALQENQTANLRLVAMIVLDRRDRSSRTEEAVAK